MKRKIFPKKQTARKSTRTSVRLSSVVREDFDEEESMGSDEEMAANFNYGDTQAATQQKQVQQEEQNDDMLTDDDDDVQLVVVVTPNSASQPIQNDKVAEEENTPQSSQVESTSSNSQKQSTSRMNDPKDKSECSEKTDDFLVTIDSDDFSTPPQTQNEDDDNAQQVGTSNNTSQQIIALASTDQPPTQSNTQRSDESLSTLDLGEDFELPPEPPEETGWITDDADHTVHAFKYKFKAGVTDKSKIAAFDLDGTLITPKSKNKFSKDIDDWKLMSASLKTKIEKLVNDGYNFVIFSNQMGVSYKFITLKQIKTKFENIIKHIDQPCVAILCTSQDRYRKPAIGMLEFYRTINKTKLNHPISFFVGDAMGRPKDHSAADLLFSYNCRLPFIPIESFLSGFFFCDEIAKNIEKITQENAFQNICVILLVGLYGSGKTFFFDKYLDHLDYTAIDYNYQRSWSEEMQMFKKLIEEGKTKIVIDQPNLDHKERKKWIDLAKEENAPIFSIHFNLNVDQCWHNVRFRSYYTDHHRTTPSQREMLNQNSKFIAPEFYEGFKHIYCVDFIPAFDIVQKKIYYAHFLNDKP